MKIGMSFSKCILDILNGEVALDDVMLIRTRTLVTADHLLDMVHDYARIGTFPTDREEECGKIAKTLWDTGRIYQPRESGVYFGSSVNDRFVWLDLYPTSAQIDDSTREAWEQYRMLLTLSLGRELPTDGAAALN